jgi:hypothetical protein
MRTRHVSWSRGAAARQVIALLTVFCARLQVGVQRTSPQDMLAMEADVAACRQQLAGAGLSSTIILELCGHIV